MGPNEQMKRIEKTITINPESLRQFGKLRAETIALPEFDAYLVIHVEATPGKAPSSDKDMTLAQLSAQKPTIITEFPSQKVEEHYRRFGHLPTTDLCDEKGTCRLPATPNQ